MFERMRMLALPSSSTSRSRLNIVATTLTSDGNKFHVSARLNKGVCLCLNQAFAFDHTQYQAEMHL